jgi:hypothetical protein
VLTSVMLVMLALMMMMRVVLLLLYKKLTHKLCQLLQLPGREGSTSALDMF